MSGRDTTREGAQAGGAHNEGKTELQRNAEKALEMKLAADVPGAAHRAGQDISAADAEADTGTVPSGSTPPADHGRRRDEGAAREGLDRSRRPR